MTFKEMLDLHDCIASSKSGTNQGTVQRIIPVDQVRRRMGFIPGLESGRCANMLRSMATAGDSGAHIEETRQTAQSVRCLTPCAWSAGVDSAGRPGHRRSPTACSDAAAWAGEWIQKTTPAMGLGMQSLAGRAQACSKQAGSMTTFRWTP